MKTVNQRKKEKNCTRKTRKKNMTLVPFKKSHMEAKKMVVNLRDVVNSIGSRQIARGIFNSMEISSLINHPSSLSGATMTVSFKSGQIPPRRSCFLTNHFMKLLANYLSATNFCWTSSTYLTDRDVISGKDMSRQTDPSICCSD